jgi:hypothetical protein
VSAKDRECADVVRVLKTFSTTGESETSEDNHPVVRYQRPAVLTSPQRKAIERAVVQVAGISKFERCGLVR